MIFPTPDCQPPPPTTPGLYWMSCGETEGEDELVWIVEQDGELWCLDTPLGHILLNSYHGGLTDCQWRDV